MLRGKSTCYANGRCFMFPILAKGNGVGRDKRDTPLGWKGRLILRSTVLMKHVLLQTQGPWGSQELPEHRKGSLWGHSRKRKQVLLVGWHHQPYPKIPLLVVIAWESQWHFSPSPSLNLSHQKRGDKRESASTQKAKKYGECLKICKSSEKLGLWIIIIITQQCVSILYLYIISILIKCGLYINRLV